MQPHAWRLLFLALEPEDTGDQVMPRLVGRSEQARVSAAKADINANISLGLDMFEMDVGRYPTSEEGLASLRANPSSLPGWKGPYLKKEPKDPWGRPYVYKAPGIHNNDYDLYSMGTNGVDDNGAGDDIGNWQ